MKKFSEITPTFITGKKDEEKNRKKELKIHNHSDSTITLHKKFIRFLSLELGLQIFEEKVPKIELRILAKDFLALVYEYYLINFSPNNFLSLFMYKNKRYSWHVAKRRICPWRLFPQVTLVPWLFWLLGILIFVLMSTFVGVLWITQYLITIKKIKRHLYYVLSRIPVIVEKIKIELDNLILCPFVPFI